MPKLVADQNVTPALAVPPAGMALEVAISTEVFVRKMPLPATDQSPLLVIVRPTALDRDAAAECRRAIELARACYRECIAADGCAAKSERGSWLAP